jgi:beta-glucosidase
LARRAAGEALVLLKNDGGLLPLGQKKIALVGEFARKPRYQGGGSSHITPTRVDDAVEEARALAGPGVEITYTPGYGRLDEARVVAKEAEVAVVFVGLTEEYESEGFDRTHLNLPPDHLALVEAVLEVQKNVVVVLSNGAPVVLPWVDRVPALVEGYLGGQAWGGAVADLLFGRTNPSGKLAETFPVRVEDNPSFLNFPGGKNQVEYREGPFVGYRHYDALRLAPLFPFGHGLSYTTFGYGPLVAARTTINEDDPLTLTVEVTNTGPVAGAEVVQLYVADLEASVVRPVRELKGFEKLWLEPGETKTVKFVVDRRAWAFWSGDTGGWTVETGQFDLAAGSSSRDLRQTVRVTVRSKGKTKKRVDQNTPFGDLADRPVGKLLVDSAVQGIRRGLGIQDPASPEARFAEAMVREMPLRNLIRMSAGRLPRALIRFLDRVIPRSGPGRHP